MHMPACYHDKHFSGRGIPTAPLKSHDQSVYILVYLLIVFHCLTNGSIERGEEWEWETGEGVCEISKCPGSLGANKEGR